MTHILIVDDDEGDRHLMHSMLGQGNELYFATNGEQAVKLYLRNPIDVVVTDIKMPRGDGIELIEALKGLDPDVAIVAVSGQLPHKLAKAQDLGARAILRKPLTMTALRKAVDDACKPPAVEAPVVEPPTQ